MFLDILNDKTMKATEKRAVIVEAINNKELDLEKIKAMSVALDSKKIVIIFEAIEAITKETPTIFDSKILTFINDYILSESNPIKRETSRIVGNVAKVYPNQLEKSVALLLENTNNEGTVVRWGSAYALSRIILLPDYINSSLYNTLKHISDMEEDNGVKKQYVNALKKADKKRN